MDIISAYKQLNNKSQPNDGKDLNIKELKKSFSDVYKSPYERGVNENIYIPNEFEPPPVLPSPLFTPPSASIQANRPPPNVQSKEFVGDFYETIKYSISQLKNLIKEFEMDESDYDRICSAIIKLEGILEDSDCDYDSEYEQEEPQSVIMVQQENFKRYGDTSLYML